MRGAPLREKLFSLRCGAKLFRAGDLRFEQRRQNRMYQLVRIIARDQETTSAVREPQNVDCRSGSDDRKTADERFGCKAVEVIVRARRIDPEVDSAQLLGSWRSRKSDDPAVVAESKEALHRAVESRGRARPDEDADPIGRCGGAPGGGSAEPVGRNRLRDRRVVQWVCRAGR